MDNRGKMVDYGSYRVRYLSFDSSLETGMETLMENQISTGSSTVASGGGLWNLQTSTTPPPLWKARWAAQGMDTLRV